MENYITLTEASERWGISERRIRTLCAREFDSLISTKYPQSLDWLYFFVKF